MIFQDQDMTVAVIEDLIVAVIVVMIEAVIVKVIVMAIVEMAVLDQLMTMKLIMVVIVEIIVLEMIEAVIVEIIGEEVIVEPKATEAADKIINEGLIVALVEAANNIMKEDTKLRIVKSIPEIIVPNGIIEEMKIIHKVSVEEIEVVEEDHKVIRTSDM